MTVVVTISTTTIAKTVSTDTLKSSEKYLQDTKSWYQNPAYGDTKAGKKSIRTLLKTGAPIKQIHS